MFTCLRCDGITCRNFKLLIITTDAFPVKMFLRHVKSSIYIPTFSKGECINVSSNSGANNVALNSKRKIGWPSRDLFIATLWAIWAKRWPITSFTAQNYKLLDINFGSNNTYTHYRHIQRQIWILSHTKSAKHFDNKKPANIILN